MPKNVIFKVKKWPKIEFRIFIRLNKKIGFFKSLPLEHPVPVTGAGRSSLGGNQKKLPRLHIFKAIELGDNLK